MWILTVPNKKMKNKPLCCLKRDIRRATACKKETKWNVLPLLRGLYWLMIYHQARERLGCQRKYGIYLKPPKLRRRK